MKNNISLVKKIFIVLVFAAFGMGVAGAAPAAKTSPQASALREEFNELRAQHAYKVKEDLKSQNLKDTRALENLKRKVGGSDIDFIKRINKALEAVNESKAFTCEKPSKTAKPYEQELYTIATTRAQIVKNNQERVALAARNSYFSLRERAVQANDLALAEEINKQMNPTPVVQTTTPKGPALTPAAIAVLENLQGRWRNRDKDSKTFVIRKMSDGSFTFAYERAASVRTTTTTSRNEAATTYFLNVSTTATTNDTLEVVRERKGEGEGEKVTTTYTKFTISADRKVLTPPYYLEETEYRKVTAHTSVTTQPATGGGSGKNERTKR